MGRIFILLPLFCLILAFQNCGAYHARNSAFESNSLDDGTTRVQRFEKAMSVVQAKCLDCHSVGGQASFAAFDITNEQDFVTKALVLPGDPSGSKLVMRLKYSGGSNATMPADGRAFTPEDFQAINDWVLRMNDADPVLAANPFTCDGPAEISQTESYFLTKKQYSNTIRDLFGSNVFNNISNDLILLPNDSFDEINHARLTSLSKESIESYFNIAKNIANQVTSSNNLTSQFFGSCANQGSPNNNCIDTYLNNFAERIFRRPLTNAEKNYARGLANGDGTFKDNIEDLLVYHLLSPHFIMRMELGSANDNQPQFALTAFELASRISYMTTDSLPDAELYALAKNGQINNPAILKAQVLRLIQTSRGRQMVVDILLRWSHMNETQDVSILPMDLLNQYFGNGLSSAMVDEAKEFIEYIVFERQGDFSELLTSKASFASHPELADIYQHAPANPQRQVGDPVAQFSGRRQGLLLRAPALTSSVPRASPIHRGVHFQASILCNELPSPPPTIFDSRFDNDLTDDEKLDTTTRGSVAHLTNDVSCQTCHSAINPTGFSFGSFGPFGELRGQEQIFDDTGDFYQNLAINASGDVPTSPGTSVAVTDAYDLVGYVANSAEGKQCFTRKMYRFIHEKREVAEDNCQLNSMYQIMESTNGNLINAFVELISSESVQWKRK